MKIGVVGLGGIFEVAYWPAFQQFQIEYPDQPIQLFGYDPKYSAEPSLASPFPIHFRNELLRFTVIRLRFTVDSDAT